MAEASLTIRSRKTLNNGVQMPIFGLGTAGDTPCSAPYDARRLCIRAISEGYRLLDTAAMYGTETQVGQAVRDCGVSRDEIFVTTKLLPSDHGFQKALLAFEKSRQNLGISPDLYLGQFATIVTGQFHTFRDSPLAGCVRAFRAAALCVSPSCSPVSRSHHQHLNELLAHCEVPPAVNQFEVSPICYPRELIEFCQQRGIAVNAYCPLARCVLMNDPTCVEIARAHQKTVAQVLLRWSIQHGLVPIPKTSTFARIHENGDIFDFVLTREEMDRLDALNRDERGVFGVIAKGKPANAAKRKARRAMFKTASSSGTLLDSLNTRNIVDDLRNYGGSFENSLVFDGLLRRWQIIVDGLAQIYGNCISHIMRCDDVFLSSVRVSGGQLIMIPLEGSFCSRTVRTSRDEFYRHEEIETVIPDAEKDPEFCWCNSEAVRAGRLRSYIGAPLFYPDGSIFGTICVVSDRPGLERKGPGYLRFQRRLVQEDLDHLGREITMQMLNVPGMVQICSHCKMFNLRNHPHAPGWSSIEDVFSIIGRLTVTHTLCPRCLQHDPTGETSSPSTTPIPTSSSAPLLVVDDCPPIVMVVRAMASKYPMAECHVATNGQECLRLMEAREENLARTGQQLNRPVGDIDCILMDIHDGNEATAEVRKWETRFTRGGSLHLPDEASIPTCPPESPTAPATDPTPQPTLLSACSHDPTPALTIDRDPRSADPPTQDAPTPVLIEETPPQGGDAGRRPPVFIVAMTGDVDITPIDAQRRGFDGISRKPMRTKQLGALLREGSNTPRAGSSLSLSLSIPQEADSAQGGVDSPPATPVTLLTASFTPSSSVASSSAASSSPADVSVETPSPDLSSPGLATTSPPGTSKAAEEGCPPLGGLSIV
ncbi:putative Prostaglandin F synthase [Paratrimastix pyriformis]|uniref:Prostaglandin F synthase n=1 Tax=Paratrimastix pyriformis TaxID=342808 RepID=A0ABQ8UQU6_9EUKA|nr:putative Prostaglandin F synthase [Paratrimastix pyriformis]